MFENGMEGAEFDREEGREEEHRATLLSSGWLLFLFIQGEVIRQLDTELSCKRASFAKQNPGNPSQDILVT